MKSTTVYSSVTTVAVVVAAVLATTTTTTTSAFTMVAPILQQRSTSVVSLQAADTAKQAETATKKVPETQQLGLLTFDLDDTLYPIQKVAEEANEAFAKAMERFGFSGLKPTDIVNTGKAIREEMAKTDPERAATLTHTEIRELAIRKEMEKIILKRKLKETADDWATQVESLSPVIKEHAKKWARNAVSESVVQAVLSAWEMERHHSAERHLYPEVIDALKKIKEEHPGVIIGAVTDGRANPKLMTFTLAPFFDFCISWEDEQGARRNFFKELDAVDGNAELTWIYDAARHKYAQLKQPQDAMKASYEGTPVPQLTYPDTYDDLVYIHVGDDLAFDVGGSKACGAKTILVELPESYGQTNPHRFDMNIQQPIWATSTASELESRIRMNEQARELVDVKINSLERLPIAINDILKGNT